jgi:hypothetical protein
VNLQNEEISNEREERNEHGAEWASKAVTYLRSILDDNDQLINKNNSRYIDCPKVPPMLRNDERSKDYYDPKIVSFGPYHHEKDELQALQTIKIKVMQNFILEHGKSIEDLYTKVCELNGNARSCYVDGSTDAYTDEEFALMMLQDGCFILFLIEWRMAFFQNNKEWMTTSTRDNILLLSHGDYFQVQYLYRDLGLLENQIPYEVLDFLMSNIYEENEGLTMIKSFLNWIQWGNFQKIDTRDEDNEVPLHLLGILKTQISKVGDHVETVTDIVGMDASRYFQSFGSVSDLEAKGINFKPSNFISLHSAKNKKPKSISLQDVEFRSGFFTGELKLPPLILSSNSKVLYRNLIALEMCDDNDFSFTSYISFMNSLIASPEDVKKLRSKHIILHTLSSDKEVFKMLKEISVTDWQQDLSIYQGIREGIEKHYKNKIKIWIAEARHKYFSQPWSVISLFAAVIVIILTFLQTFYTINPRKA